MRALTSLLAGLALVALAFGGGHLTGIARGVAQERASAAAALVAAEQQNAAEQRRLMAAIDQLAQENQHARTQIDRDLAGTRDSYKRLLAAIRDADARANTGPACVADAAAARSQLADCAERYRDVAERADQLRATVIGLQAYAHQVSTQRED